MIWRVEGPDGGAPLAAPEAQAFAAELQPWYTPESWFEEIPGVLCATDLLVAWKPDTVVSPLAAPGHVPAAGDWNAYFAGTTAAATADTAGPARDATSDLWDPGASAAAVECLFDWVHALERADVPEAMRCISPEFHTLERDIEQDKNGLRLWLERRVDEWRGPELRVTLTGIPEPASHPMGTLIRFTLQVDHRNPFREALETELLGFVALLDAEPRGEMQIRSLCRVS